MLHPATMLTRVEGCRAMRGGKEGAKYLLSSTPLRYRNHRYERKQTYRLEQRLQRAGAHPAVSCKPLSSNPIAAVPV